MLGVGKNICIALEIICVSMGKVLMSKDQILPSFPLAQVFV